MGSLPSLPSDRIKQQENRLLQSTIFKKQHKKTSSVISKTSGVESSDNKSIQENQYKQEEHDGGRRGVVVKEDIVSSEYIEQQQHQFLPDKLVAELLDYNNDPMLAAANKVSQQFEKERAALMDTTTTGEPYIIAAYRENDSSSSTYSSSDTTLTERFMKVFPDVKTTAFTSSKELVLQTFIRTTTNVENGRERDRQQRLHYTLKRVLKSGHRANIENPKLIVNWLSGAGLWDIEMSEKFPDCKIIAIDYKSHTLGDISSRFPNVEFRYTLQETYTGMETIDSNTVDYIMLRDCWMINSPSYKWLNVLNQAFRILKPNGLIELSESSLYLKPEGKGKETVQLYGWFRVLFKYMDIDVDMCTKLSDVLKSSGFISIDQTSYSIPVGEWSEDKDSRETGYLFKDMLEKRFRGLVKWLYVLNDVEEEEIQRVITACLEEEAEANCFYIDWISYIARKPAIDFIDNPTCSNNPIDPLNLQKKSSTSPQI